MYLPQIEVFQNALIKNKGCPRQSLVLEQAISTRARVDLMIIDPEDLSPLALIEFKSLRHQESIYINRQIEHFLEEIGKDVPVFVVSVDEEDETISCSRYDIKSKKLEEIDFEDDFPEFKNLRINGDITKKKKRKKTINDFKWASYSLAALLFLVFVLEKCGLFVVSNTNLALLGLIAALIVMPHAAELKLMGVEFKAKRVEEEPENDKQK